MGQSVGNKSAFGFPANANPMGQQQLNNENGANEGKDNEGNNDNNKNASNQKLTLTDVLSPASEDNKDKDGNGNGGNILSPKTPTMIDHVVDRVYFIAKTQSGSRFVQEKLSDKQYFGLFFKELKCHVAEL